MNRQAAMKFALGIAVVLGAASAGANAAPIFAVTPSGASPSLSGTAFSADTINISDFSTVTYGATVGTTASFTDQGYLDIINFQLANNPSVSPDLNVKGGYGLFFAFSATGTQSVVPDSGGNFDGKFTTLTYTLFGYNQTAGTPYLFNASATGATANPNGNPTATALATGSLTCGTVTISSAGVPSASVCITFTPLPGESGLFSSPNPFYGSLSAAFINLSNQVTSYPTSNVTFASGSGFYITNGGGSANFVPEPAAYAVFGIALLSLALVRRSRTNG